MTTSTDFEKSVVLIENCVHNQAVLVFLIANRRDISCTMHTQTYTYAEVL